MAYQFSNDPQKWQTLYTRDDAYRDSGKHASTYSNTFLASILIASGFVALRLTPILNGVISRLIGVTQTNNAVALLLSFLLSIVLTYLALHFAQTMAYRYAVGFFSDFHQPPEGVDPNDIIKYRLTGRFKLPPPFTPLLQFKYLLVQDGEIAKANEWPAWMARTLGGPLILIIFDGYALYLERGNQFSRVVGPGENIPFLEWYETIKYVVDLRPKVHVDYVNVWTRDGIRVKLTIRVESRIGDPQKKDPSGNLIYPFDSLAVKKAIERFAVRWPTCPEGEPEEFTWIHAVWGQVTSVVPNYIGSRMLDDLFVADKQGGAILSHEATTEIKNKLDDLTKVFGVHILDFQVTKVEIPPEIEIYQKEFWKAEKQGAAMRVEGETIAYGIEQREKTRAYAQRDIITAIGRGLQKNTDGQFTEPVLLSLSRILDQSLNEPLTRAYLAKETLDALEQLHKYLIDQTNANR